jgi:hypothetical protein
MRRIPSGRPAISSPVCGAFFGKRGIRSAATLAKQSASDPKCTRSGIPATHCTPTSYGSSNSSYELDAHRDALLEIVCAYGYALRDAATTIDENTTITQRCELLNVNASDRTNMTDADGVLNILFVHVLEDSAERRHCEPNDGPLFTCLAHMAVNVLETRERHAAPVSTLH